MDISSYIDHTLLKAVATENEIIQLCKEALEYQFFAVCVNSSYVPLCQSVLQSSAVKTAAVVGFPLGASDTATKVFEAQKAIENGADEIDMVIHIGMLKDKKMAEVEREINAIKTGIGEKILKVIIETCYLTDEEKKTATQLSVNAGADFVKTSTGFGTGGATLADVALMRSVTKDYIKIKASGGIRDFATAQQYIAAGVSRIGTSNGIQIVSGISGNENLY